MTRKRLAKRHGDAKHVPGVSRRSFLTTAGVGVVGVAVGQSGTAAGPPTAAAPDPVLPAGELVRIGLRVNGRDHRLLVEPRWSLLHVLREQIGLTGAKPGCERGECGACSVLIDDLPRYSCMTLAVESEGSDITTLEGLLEGEQPGAVQRAFIEHDAFQCGYCTPGQIVAVEALLRATPNPSPEQIRQGVSGNLCRCGAYPNIFKAVRRAAELRSGNGGKS